MLKNLLRGLTAKLRAEMAFIVLLAVAGAGAWLYVQLRSVTADRDDLLRRAELICASAGGDFTAGKLKRGEACRLKIAGLADFKARTDQITAETLAKALADHDARQLTDNNAARRAAEAARDAAHRMEIADAEAERRNLVDREWTAAVNGVAGLRAPPR
ncbi:hypothetical protein [Sphingomonas sp. 8AM]|uniref:hypothetical protein n=1 Tax=Sphingomonas sp. 8AM TaxID=2653170 RepID=UPI0012F125B1|nr:hypothetical protein [Sphingomonas sp. 8AM]VXC90757.1 conserved hypothetical protein [Sphingomonas sp. 8AM]